VTASGGPLFAIEDDLGLARRLLAGAAEVALGYFGRPNRSELKADGTPVGEADLAVDRFLVEQLRRDRPDDAILSEESGTVETPSGRRWIIDPIDGTEAFLAGAPHWGTHVALEQDGSLVLGAVSRPIRGRAWWAARGLGAHHGALDPSVPDFERCELSRVSSLDGARVTGWPLDSLPVTPVLTRATWVDCEYNDLMLILDGRAEVMLVPGRVWDHAPFQVLLEEAGGSLFDPQGGQRIDLGAAVYTNGKVDRELVGLVWPR